MFATQTTAFEDPDALTLAEENPNPTHGGRDLLGFSGLQVAGKMSRAGNSLMTQRPVSDEWVSFWQRNGSGWSQLDRTKTANDGTFGVTLGADVAAATGTAAVFAILEGDGTCALHGVFRWPSGTRVIVTDIDGTLTYDDNELIKQVMGNPTYVPKDNASAAQMLQTWYAKGYFPVYVSARSHDLRGISRSWLHEVGAPFGPLQTADTFVYDESAREYKAAFLRTITTELGWTIVAAYGNASSDIQAYEDAGIAKEVTFIVGPEAGTSGTQPIGGNDYSEHIRTYIENQPDATQPF